MKRSQAARRSFAFVSVLLALAVPAARADTFTVVGSHILKNGTLFAACGVNAMHVFGGGSADTNAWNVKIVREFIGNLRENPIGRPGIDDNVIKDRTGAFLHPLQAIVDDNRWICQRLQQPIPDWQARLQAVKNAAYAWRQMIFFLPLEPEASVNEFLAWAAEHLEQQRAEFQARYQPVLTGLKQATLPSYSEALNGWSTGTHWLLR